MIIESDLRAWCAENGIEIKDVQVSKFLRYADLLVEWNRKINLTSITDPHDIAIKHFIDSISVLICTEIKRKATLIDIGTGAGFPGIPIKIMRDDIELTLMDSLNKRLNFLREVCVTLEIKAELIHSRAEDGGRIYGLRESYDAAISRAVAGLPVLCEYCLPYVKKGGIFIAMKGPDGDEELKQAKKAIEILGGRVREIRSLTLPDDLRRTLIIIEKITSTPDIYPRRSVKINKMPL